MGVRQVRASPNPSPYGHGSGARSGLPFYPGPNPNPNPNPNPSPNPNPNQGSQRAAAEKLERLASAQRMNTDLRRGVFVAIMARPDPEPKPFSPDPDGSPNEAPLTRTTPHPEREPCMTPTLTRARRTTWMQRRA